MSVLINADAAAAKLGCTRKSLYAAVARHGVPHVRLGESIRFDPVDLDRFIELLKTRGRCCPTCGQVRLRPMRRVG